MPALLAEIEQAWLSGRPEAARPAVQLLAERPAGAGPERQRGELLRWRRRLGEQVEPFPGCPEEFAAGIRGDWRVAAEAWCRIGAPYERALELAGSGDTAATREALALLDDLGARPAAARVRHRLRRMGVTVVPTTRANPAGLTDARSRSSGWSPQAGPTGRSPPSSWSRCGPWTTTCRPCCRSSA